MYLFGEIGSGNKLSVTSLKLFDNSNFQTAIFELVKRWRNLRKKLRQNAPQYLEDERYSTPSGWYSRNGSYSYGIWHIDEDRIDSVPIRIKKDVIAKELKALVG